MLLLLRASFEKQPIYLAKSNIFHQPTLHFSAIFKDNFPSQFRKPFFGGAQQKLCVFFFGRDEIWPAAYQPLPPASLPKIIRPVAGGLIFLVGWIFFHLGWLGMMGPRDSPQGWYCKRETPYKLPIYHLYIYIFRDSCMGGLYGNFKGLPCPSGSHAKSMFSGYLYNLVSANVTKRFT